MRTILFSACAVALAAAAQQTDTRSGASGPERSATPGTSATGEAMPHAPPKPAEALTAAFKDSVGTWECTGKMTMPGGAEMTSRSHMTIRRELNGFLYEGEWRVEKSQAFPEMRGKMDWSYDPQAKKLIQHAVDSMGNTSRGESDGMQDGKLVWVEEGTMMGQPSKMRTTIATTGPNRIELTFEQQGSGGSWQPMGKDSCTKAGAKTATSK
jgi:hypothetical protein